jgi:hypothetical protein
VTVPAHDFDRYSLGYGLGAEDLSEAAARRHCGADPKTGETQWPAIDLVVPVREFRAFLSLLQDRAVASEELSMQCSAANEPLLLSSAGVVASPFTASLTLSTMPKSVQSPAELKALMAVYKEWRDRQDALAEGAPAEGVADAAADSGAASAPGNGAASHAYISQGRDATRHGFNSKSEPTAAAMAGTKRRVPPGNAEDAVGSSDGAEDAAIKEGTRSAYAAGRAVLAEGAGTPASTASIPLHRTDAEAVITPSEAAASVRGHRPAGAVSGSATVAVSSEAVRYLHAGVAAAHGAASAPSTISGGRRSHAALVTSNYHDSMSMDARSIRTATAPAAAADEHPVQGQAQVQAAGQGQGHQQTQAGIGDTSVGALSSISGPTVRTVRTAHTTGTAGVSRTGSGYEQNPYAAAAAAAVDRAPTMRVGAASASVPSRAGSHYAPPPAAGNEIGNTSLSQ